MRVGMAAVFQNPGWARSDFDVSTGTSSGSRRPTSAEQCCDNILNVRRRVGNDHFVGVFSCAGMSPAEAERRMRLPATEAMSALQRLEHGGPR